MKRKQEQSSLNLSLFSNEFPQPSNNTSTKDDLCQQVFKKLNLNLRNTKRKQPLCHINPLAKTPAL